MVCLMEQQSQEGKITTKPDRAYFQSQTYINLETTDVKKFYMG